MRLTLFSPFALLAIIPASWAQEGQNATYLGGLTEALNATGLTRFATIAAAINSTIEGEALLSELPKGNLTLFVPNDEAFSTLPATISGNTTLLAEILSYHVVSGNFTNLTTTYPNITIGRTRLNSTDSVALEGNRSQVVAFTKLNNTVQILNQATNVTVVNTTSYVNLEVFIIDAVLLPPGNLTTVLSFNNLTMLETVLTQTIIPSPANSTNISLAEALDSSGIRGYTLFAPNNAAFQAAASTLLGLSANITALELLLGNHLINATTVYSPSLLSNGTNYTSSAGEPLSFNTNSSGTFVTSGNNTAKIVQSDALVKNGVVHVIDQVLVDLEVNQAAASSAFVSATSVAAKTTTETGPVGVPTSTATSSASASGKSSSAAPVALNSGSGAGWAAAVTVAGAFLGAMIVV